jgi:hypothetical protein
MYFSACEPTISRLAIVAWIDGEHAPLLGDFSVAKKKK